MGWRYEGTNWAGDEFWVSFGLRALLDEIDVAYPGRPRTSDGTVASKRHDLASPTSDHSPDSDGIVRAGDVTEPSEQAGTDIVEYLRMSRDARIKYVIYEGRIFSSYARRDGSRAAWEWGDYSGYNPHNDHIHISLHPHADSDLSPWGIATNLEGEEMSLGEGDRGEAVREYQKVLVALYDLEDDWADGIYGPATARQVKLLQEDYGLASTGRIDGLTGSLLATIKQSEVGHVHGVHLNIDHTTISGKPTVRGDLNG